MKDQAAVTSQRYSFIVMDRRGRTLEHYFKKNENGFDLETIVQVGCQLLKILQKVHSIGMVYNDLKLENILVNKDQDASNTLSDISLVNFGFCTDYLDSDGEHIPYEQTKECIGNIATSSINAMNFMAVSRRDDLISLTYLLLYMAQGKLDFLKINKGDISNKK